MSQIEPFYIPDPIVNLSLHCNLPKHGFASLVLMNKLWGFFSKRNYADVDTLVQTEMKAIPVPKLCWYWMMIWKWIIRIIRPTQVFENCVLLFETNLIIYEINVYYILSILKYHHHIYYRHFDRINCRFRVSLHFKYFLPLLALDCDDIKS